MCDLLKDDRNLTVVRGEENFFGGAKKKAEKKEKIRPSHINRQFAYVVKLTANQSATYS